MGGHRSHHGATHLDPKDDAAMRQVSSLRVCICVAMARRPTFHKRNVDRGTRVPVDRPTRRSIRIAALAPARLRELLRSPVPLLTPTTVPLVPEGLPSVSSDSSTLPHLQMCVTRSSSSTLRMTGTALRNPRARRRACCAPRTRSVVEAVWQPEACPGVRYKHFLFV